MRRELTVRGTKQIGFTFIELMIVVAIVAIISAIAYPSYQSYLARGYRSNAQTVIMEELQAQSRFYAQNLVYSSEAQTGANVFTENPQYNNITITCAPSNANCTSITVTANVNAGMDATCGNLSQTNTGDVSAAVAANGAECWAP